METTEDVRRKAHFKKMQGLQKNAHELKKALHELWGTTNPEEQAWKLTQRIGDVEATITMETYQHFAQIRELCDESQQLRFDQIVKEISRRREPLPNAHRPAPHRNNNH